MKGLGSGENGEFTFLDILSIMSFYLGVQNLDLNISQENIDNQTQVLDERLHNQVEEIHRHLTTQDEKLNIILRFIQENGGVIVDEDKGIG